MAVLGKGGKPGDFFVIQYTGHLYIYVACEFHKYFDPVSFSAVDEDEMPVVKWCADYELREGYCDEGCEIEGLAQYYVCGF